MKIVVAWELGDNFGHLLRQLPIIKLLKERGHSVLFVVKDVQLANKTLGKDNVPFVQAPVPRPTRALVRKTSSYADILFSFGFGEQDVLGSMVAAWQHLYRENGIELAVIDHAPAALLAARLLGIPTMNVSTGFNIPPLLSPYPSFRPWLNLPESDFIDIERTILKNVNSLCREQDGGQFEKLSDLMRADSELICTFPELDHYSGRLNGHYVGALFTASDGIEVAWPEGKGSRIFVYLRPSAMLVHILTVLREISANVICFIPGIEKKLIDEFATETLRIYDSALRLESLFADCDLAITMSGHGMIAACLLEGIPMLLIPVEVEQLMLSNCVKRMGTGLAMSLGEIEKYFAAGLNRLLTESKFSDCAKFWADKYKGYDQKDTIWKIVQSIEQSKPANERRNENFGVESCLSGPVEDFR